MRRPHCTLVGSCTAERYRIGALENVKSVTMLVPAVILSAVPSMFLTNHQPTTLDITTYAVDGSRPASSRQSRIPIQSKWFARSQDRNHREHSVEDDDNRQRGPHDILVRFGKIEIQKERDDTGFGKHHRKQVRDLSVEQLPHGVDFCLWRECRVHEMLSEAMMSRAGAGSQCCDIEALALCQSWIPHLCIYSSSTYQRKEYQPIGKPQVFLDQCIGKQPPQHEYTWKYW